LPFFDKGVRLPREIISKVPQQRSGRSAEEPGRAAARVLTLIVRISHLVL
jgi:hypothetical protein